MHIRGRQSGPAPDTEANGGSRQVATAGNTELWIEQMGKSGPQLGQGRESLHWIQFFLKNFNFPKGAKQFQK
jgi:hypothetical protein